MAARPLAKALHTVTAVSRLAIYLSNPLPAILAATPTNLDTSARRATAMALKALGYHEEARELEAGNIPSEGGLIAACVAATKKGLQP